MPLDIALTLEAAVGRSLDPEGPGTLMETAVTITCTVRWPHSEPFI